MFELQVRRNGVWKLVDAVHDSTLAIANANTFYRGNRRRRSIRVMHNTVDGCATQVFWMAARSR